MLDNVQVLCHNSIRITGSKTIYIDPFKIKENYNDADYIFCTHSHYDHFSKEDILKVIKENTIIITVESSRSNAEEIVGKDKVIIVEPNKEYEIMGLKFKTTYAYNINKQFHPKENNWVGFIINFDNKNYYIAGDTDNIPEIQNIECDVAFLPIGGTYTMTVDEAVNLASTIKAQIIVPTHYGEIVGDKSDGESFAKRVANSKILI